MRYTDEGNLRFVGNTRTSTSTQGVYRQEFDSGKWAVTLTNTEPGIGYLGYNVEALSYDFENSRLCTENIRASCVELSGNISAICINSLDKIYTQCLESCCGLGFECGCISNGPAEIRIYGRPDCSGPDDGCLVVADNYLCYCTRNGCSSITVDSDGLNFSGSTIRTDDLIYTTNNHTLCTCNLKILGELCDDINAGGNLKLSQGLYLGDAGDVCIYDRCGSDVLCSYDGALCIYGCQFLNGSYTSDKSYIEMDSDDIRIGHGTGDGSFGISLCSADDCIAFRGAPASEEIKFHNGNTITTTSSCLKLDNDVCVSDIFTIGSGSNTKCHYIHTVSLNSVSYTSDDGTIDLGNITATVDLNNTNSLFITNCTFSNPPLSSIVIGHNACAAVDSRPGYYATRYSVAIGDGAEVCGDNNVAIGCKTCAVGNSVSVGSYARSCDYGIAIGKGVYAKGLESIAIGCGAQANCIYSIAIGIDTTANGIDRLAIGRFSATNTYGTACVNSNIKKGPLREITVTWYDSTLKCDIWNAIACNLDLRKNGKGTILTSGCTYLSATGYIGNNQIPIYACNYDYNSSLDTMCSVVVRDLDGCDIMTISATCTAAATDAAGGGFLTITGWSR